MFSLRMFDPISQPHRQVAPVVVGPTVYAPLPTNQNYSPGVTLVAPGYAPAPPPLYVLAPAGAYAPQGYYPGVTYGAPPPQPVIRDNGLQVRCLHCKKFFLRSENGPASCVHHSGKFTEPITWQGSGAGALNLGRSMKKWSCCGEIAPSEPGCCKGYHQEDIATTQILDKFNRPNVPSSSSSSSSTPAQPETTSFLDSWLTTGSTYAATSTPPLSSAAPSLNSVTYTSSSSSSSSSSTPSSSHVSKPKPNSATKEEGQKRDEEEKEKDLIADGYIKHPVALTDTLQGLSLRYGVPADEIKKVNKIFSPSSLIARKYVYVRVNRDVTLLPPPVEESEEQRKRKMVNKFLDIAKNSSKDEARGYLSACDWDLAKALQELEADRTWEAQHAPGTKRPLLR